MPLPDYYAILQISPTANPDEIKAAYSSLVQSARLYNKPPRHRLTWIREANFVLGDPARRAKYDFYRLSHPIEIAETTAALDELYYHPESHRPHHPTRGQRILYAMLVLSSGILVWGLLSARLDILIYWLVGTQAIALLLRIFVNLREPPSHFIDEDLR